MGFLTILTIISEYSKQTVFFSIVLKAGWPKTLFSLRGQKLTFVYFFSLSRQYGSDMFWAALLSSVSICTGLVETPELSHPCLTVFPGYFGDNIFFHFFFQGGRTVKIPEFRKIPEN